MIWDLLMCISVAVVDLEGTRRIASAWILSAFWSPTPLILAASCGGEHQGLNV